MTPYLTDTEINAICDGLTQPHAMVRFLKKAGFTVLVKPNGRPLVSRANFEAITGGNAIANPTAAAKPTAREPNIAGVVNLFPNRAAAR